MSWGAVAGAAISIGAGILGGKSGKKQAKRDRESEAMWREREWQQGQDEFNWTKKVYGEHQEKFDPLFDEMRASMDDVEPDYAAIAGDVGSAFDSARGMERREQRRYGIKPTSGAAQQAQREYGIKRGAAHVGARSAARAGAKEQKYARRADLYSAGMGIGSNKASQVGQSIRNQGIIAGGQAREAGADARYSDARSLQDSAGWGQAVGSIDWGGLFNEVKGWGSGNSGGGGGSSRTGGM